MGCFLKTSCEGLDKKISEPDWDEARQDIHAHPSIKGVFTPSCVQTNPLLHSCEQDPLPVQLR
jgi:hypothetical protein